MKYLPQLLIIFGLSALAELLHALIPLPIPASIYGMILLFFALSLKILKLEQVKPTGPVLTTLLSLLFVSPLVNLLDCWDRVGPNLIPIGTILMASTAVSFVVAGVVTQRRIHKGGDHD